MAQSNPGSNLDIARLLFHYTTMCRIRAFENAAIGALKDGHVPGPLHPSIGQEAVASGVCAELEAADILLSTHRGHGHTLVKGAPPLAMMRELLGREGGCCAGKGGSMHIADFGVGMLGANGVVGANILIAAGAAHALKIKRSRQVAVCIFGDGAVNRGPFLEGLNWARIYQLPVLFVCEDNTYAATTYTVTMTAGDGPAARAESLGIPTTTVDGNDVLEVEQASRAIVTGMRAGSGPQFLHAKTFRLTGHTATDADAYRDAALVKARWQDDPISRCAATLASVGVAEDELSAVRSAATAEMAAAVHAALDTPWPETVRAFDDVHEYADGPAAGILAGQ